MKVLIVNEKNDNVAEADLSDAVFGIQDIRTDIIARVVQWQRDKARSGTRRTKGRSEIAKTGKKIFRQKGTGNARHGAASAPQFRGGGRAFGPVVRSHGYSLNKKIRSLGLRMALSSRAKAGLTVLESVPSNANKTKDIVRFLNAHNIENALFIMPNSANENFVKAVANVPNIDVLPVCGANVYSIMKRKHLFLTQESVAQLEERLS